MKQCLLPKDTHLQLINIFQAFPEVEQVKLYGSRAKGTATNRSDIDLAAYGTRLNRFIIAEILMACDDSEIVNQVDLQDYAEIKNLSLKEHISRVGVTIYSINP